MALNDLYRVRVNCSSNNRAWSFGYVLEQIGLDSSDDQSAQLVSDAVVDHIGTELQNILTIESHIQSVQAWKIYQATAISGYTPTFNTPGTQAGDTMPNNSPMVFQLRQSTGAAKFNGSIFISGQSENNTDGGNWSDPYLTGAVQLFADKLQDAMPAKSPATGSWSLAVLSKKFTPPSLPIGTPLLVTSVSAAKAVLTSHRRTTKVDGFV